MMVLRVIDTVKISRELVDQLLSDLEKSLEHFSRAG
jgi:hypothetical protein